MSLTAERVRELLNYNSETGVFTWRATRNTHRIGSVAGTQNGCGYRQITICGKIYLAHRLAWLHVHGVWPNTVDHIDRDRGNNRISNLRDVTPRINQQNRNRGKNNKSGATGVRRRAPDHRYRKLRWEAFIWADKYNYLGTFSRKKDAVSARQKAEQALNWGAHA